MNVFTIIYLIVTFIALYMFSFFIFLTINNHSKIFSHPTPNNSHFISIIVPAYNEEDNIEDTIKHVTNLNYPSERLEIIVVNDGSSDNTSKIVKGLIGKYSNLKLIDKKNSGKADSLNFAISQAKGDLVAVVDSDSFPSKDSLLNLTGFFDDEKMSAVTSFVTVRNKSHNFFAKLQSIEYVLMAWSRKLLDFVDSVFVTNGPLSLYRKKYIDEVGGFDCKTVTEDIDITWNLMNHGYKTAMALDASVTTVVPHKFKPWFRQRTRWGMGGIQALMKYKHMFFKKGMFGAFVLPFVSFSILMSVFVFIFSIFMILRHLFSYLLSLTYSVVSDSMIFSMQEINLFPSVLLFYFIILFSLSISYTFYILKKTKYIKSITIKKLFNVIFYLTIYLSTYPIVWFASFYRLFKGDMRW
jgi:poly-beta-1,6-N-acetyl-D-glucosamine synthase